MSDNIAEGIKAIVEDFSLYCRLLKIRDKEARIVPLVLNAPQRKYHQFKQDLRARSVPIRIIILKYRQGGFTTFEQGESYWMAGTRENQEIITMAHTEDSAKKIFQMVQLFHDTLDPHFKPDRKRDSSSKLEFPKRRCNFEIATAGSAKIGVTLSKAHCSEFAYYQDAVNTLNLLKEAIPLTGDLILESTPNGFNAFEDIYSGADDLYHPRPKSEVTNAFYRFFIRWFDDPQYQFPDVKRWDDLEKATGKIQIDEKILIETYQITPAQLAWRRWKILEFQGDLEQFWEKYPENDIQCFISSGRSFFNLKEILHRMISWANQNPPEKTDTSLGLKIWEKPQAHLKYVAGADPAEGVEEDLSAFHLCEEKSGRTVLTFAKDDLSIHDFTKLVYGYCREYNDAFLVVERNNHGHTVLNELIHHHDYHRPHQLYHHHNYFEDFKPLKSQIRKEFSYGYEPGFPTKSNTKAMLLDNCKLFAEEYPEACLDLDTIAEVKTYKRLKGGKLGAEPPKKDDRVTAWALAQWGRKADLREDNYIKTYKTY